MKMIPSVFTAAAAATILLLGTAFAQSQSGMGAGVKLPAACQAAKAPEMPGMANMQPMMQGMGEHQQALMQGMTAVEGPMMQGMMAKDPDIAFACAMIPHHQGAINMAEVELQQGDSEEMKQVAQKIINDQKKEIEQLTKWIESQAQ